VEQPSRSEFVIVLTTVDATVDHPSIATTLVAERLAACVNALPVMTSTYRWKGGVETASERQLVIKTTAARLPELLHRIGELHPYDVPELLVLPVSDVEAGYGRWLREAVRPS
jgi:periplasmic divalent cation tolerance protein